MNSAPGPLPGQARPRSPRQAAPWPTAVTAAGCLVLAACGGGGGGGDGTPSYTVTPSAGANGSLSPATAQTIRQGEATSFTVTADSGFDIAGVTGCGGTLTGSTYTIAAITADCTVTASFTPVTPPPAPALSLTPRAIKTFRFSWDAVPGATEYRLLENADGSSGYTQVAGTAGSNTSLDLGVFLPRRVNASYILEACNSGGCTDSNTVFVSGTLAEATGYVKASNTGANDGFGSSIALSDDGNTLAVAARDEDSAATGINGDQDDNSAANSGAVYLFVRNQNLWRQQAYIKASNTDADDRFGANIALSENGNTLAVGADGEGSAATGINGNQADNSAVNSGAAYVFTRSGNVWTQQAYIKASNTEAPDGFGFSIALSNDGDTLAVGALREGSAATGIGGNQADNSAAGSGAVYLFSRSGGSWSQQAYLKASNTGAGDQFGWRIALSDDGQTLAVGALFEDSAATGIGGNQADDSASNSGAAYVFTRSGTTWTQQAYVKASTADVSDRFGTSIALSGDGDTLAVGADGEESAATGIGGNQADNSARFSGAVYVFTRSGTIWSQQVYVKASNTDQNDQFGQTVALASDGNTLVVGARGDASNATGIGGDQADNSAAFTGAVYVFARSGNDWSQRAYVKASNSGAGDQFSTSLGVSGDGNTLAVGARSEASNATGIGNNQNNDNTSGSGAVYLY